MNGLQGGRRWKVEHTHTALEIQMSLTPLQKLSCPHTLHSLPLSLSLVALFLAVSEFIRCESGGQLRTAHFHLVFCSVGHRVSPRCARPHFR